MLKKEKVKTQITEENKNKNKITNIKDLSKIIGLQIIKEIKNNNTINDNTDNTNIINDENKKK